MVVEADRRERRLAARRRFARVIQQARADRGLGVRELARAAGISASSLARIEAADVGPSIEIVVDLATGLGLGAAELLALVESPDEPQRSPGRERLGSEEKRLLTAFDRVESGRRRLVLEVVEALGSPDADPSPPREEIPKQQSVVSAVDHYVLGWRSDTARADPGARLDHLGSGQFSKPFKPIRAGDVIWVVFVEDGRLYVAGRMVVAPRGELDPSATNPDDVIFTQRETDRLARQMKLGYEPWEAPEHLFGRASTSEPVRILPLPSDVVEELSFITGSGPSDINLEDGNRVAAQAFRSLRVLSPESAAELERFWAQHRA